MLTREQWLLGKIAEEAAEVAQRALKAQQFGLTEVQRDQVFTNGQRLLQETWDLVVVLRLLCGDGSELPEAGWTIRKYDKLRKYLQLSQGQGQVDPEVRL